MEKQRKNLKHTAYETIKKKIITGDLQGGDPVFESELVKLLGISRTPIREALNMLQHEHLVEIYPKQGVFVTRVSYKDVIDIYSLRLLIEPYAVRIATERIDRDILEREYQFWSKYQGEANSNEHVRKDRQLHSRIVKATDNKYLIVILEQLYDKANRIRNMSLRTIKERQAQTGTEHTALLSCMLEGDAEAAANAMRDHLTKARDTALKLFS
jgi:DNA-binding GntR family transcriptional regulator